MKHLLAIFVLLSTASCTTQNTGSKRSEFISDTISVTFKRFSSLPDAEPQKLEYTLIKETYVDSLLIFKYFKDTSLTKQFMFSINDGLFGLIQDTTDAERLVVVDEFKIRLGNEKLDITKYEKFLPPMDGDIGMLFNEKYGQIGYSPYSWGSKTILTNWNSENLEMDLKSALIAEGVRHLSRQQPIAPKFNQNKIEIVEDEEELEVEF